MTTTGKPARTSDLIAAWGLTGFGSGEDAPLGASSHRCTTNQPHCTLCGTTDREALTTGDQGYSACCNEPVAFGADCGYDHR